MQQSPVLSGVITRLAHHYWGEPNRALSRGIELRFGTHGSKAVNVEQATWFDHEENIGGGVVDLIKHQEPGVSVPDRLAEFGLTKVVPNKRKETIWNYTNAGGETIYQVVRIDDASGKTYRQRQLTPDGKPVWNMLGVTPVPYRLPELIKSTGTIFIAEGEKSADALVGLGLIATTNHGGAGKWRSELTHHFQGRDVVILPDNDEPGRNHATKIATDLNGVALSIKIVPLPDLPIKGDAYDFIANGGTKTDLLNLVEATAFYNPQQQLADADTLQDNVISHEIALPILGWNELQDRPVNWLIQDLLPAQGFAALYGKPGSYKSFAALYIAGMIGSGNSAFGKETTKGDVIYIAGEGSTGLKSRRDALEKKYNLTAANVFFIPQQLNLRSADDDRQKLISAIRAKNINPILIIVDTLARAFAGGNENASEDMGAFIRQIGKLQEELNTAVLIVHHSGKDEARGQRGHSSLLGAVDAELEVTKHPKASKDERLGQITVTKQKDGEDGFKIGYRMDVVSLGLVDLNKSSLALVPMELEDMPEKITKKGLTAQQKLALRALEKAIEQDGKVVTLPNIPPNTRSVDIKFWRSMFNAMFAGEKDARRIAFKRCLEVLQETRTIGFWDDLVWITEPYA